MFCRECGIHIKSKVCSGGICQTCHSYFEKGGTINPIPKYGKIEYDVNGRVVCHICGRAFIRLGSHVQQRHNMTIKEYKKEFGLYANAKTTEDNYSKTMSRHAYNNDMDKQVQEVGKNTRMKKGHTFRARRVEDLTNKKFNMLTVVEKIIINNRTYWKCKCDCGGEKITETHKLKQGLVKTCGCRGTMKRSIAKVLEKYCVDESYVSVVMNEILNKNNINIDEYKGVTYRKDRNKYKACIKYQGKEIFLGNYDNVEDAIVVRKIAEEYYFGKYNKE